MLAGVPALKNRTWGVGMGVGFKWDTPPPSSSPGCKSQSGIPIAKSQAAPMNPPHRARANAGLQQLLFGPMAHAAAALFHGARVQTRAVRCVAGAEEAQEAQGKNQPLAQPSLWKGTFLSEANSARNLEGSLIQHMWQGDHVKLVRTYLVGTGR